jgi:type IV pilus assembly protein PilB
MGLEPFVLTAALEMIVAQRLMRRLCERCKEPYAIGEEELRREGWPASLELPEAGVLYKRVGCEFCDHTGVLGRVAIHEVLPASDAIRELVLERASVQRVEAQAVIEGMETLKVAALRRVRAGQTTVEECYRVLG